MQTLIKLSLFVFLFLGVIQLTLNQFDKPSEDSITVSSFKSEADLIDQQIPSLEMVLVSKKEVSGYIIETYREYESYKDKSGEIIKDVPTSNYDYLRYKKY